MVFVQIKIRTTFHNDSKIKLFINIIYKHILLDALTNLKYAYLHFNEANIEMFLIYNLKFIAFYNYMKCIHCVVI